MNITPDNSDDKLLEKLFSQLSKPAVERVTSKMIETRHKRKVLWLVLGFAAILIARFWH